MRFNSEFDNLSRKFGLKFQNAPKTYTPTFVLGTRNGQPITVADMIGAIEYAIRFIKAYFDVDIQKYKIALKIFRIAELRYQNNSTRNPSKKDLHVWVDVVHEIEDMRAKSDVDKRENEKISLAFDLLIEIYTVE